MWFSHGYVQFPYFGDFGLVIPYPHLLRIVGAQLQLQFGGLEAAQKVLDSLKQHLAPAPRPTYQGPRGTRKAQVGGASNQVSNELPSLRC